MSGDGVHSWPGTVGPFRRPTGECLNFADARGMDVYSLAAPALNPAVDLRVGDSLLTSGHHFESQLNSRPPGGARNFQGSALLVQLLGQQG